jgi:hypothetical protein
VKSLSEQGERSKKSGGFLFVVLVGPRVIQQMLPIFGLAHFSGAFQWPI